nr:hypothetical protein [Tanacetum cinerariifolium]
KAIERFKQAATRNRGKAIVNSPPPTYDQEPTMVAEDDEMSKEKEIDKLMALISLSFKKIYKRTNNNLRTSSNTSRENQDITPRINRGTGSNKEDVALGFVVLVSSLEALQVTNTVCRLFLVGASFTQGTIPSIPIGSSISPKGFLLPILLLVVIKFMAVIFAVILVVVVVVIVGVVIIVTIIGVIIGVVVVATIIRVVVVTGVFVIIRLSFVIIGFLHKILLCYLIH